MIIRQCQPLQKLYSVLQRINGLKGYRGKEWKLVKLLIYAKGFKKNIGRNADKF